MPDPSDRSIPAMEPQGLQGLRSRAAIRLAGPAAAQGAAARAADALNVLYTLASAPETAPDALALLHELQVHQVELDLQAQELQESRAELATALQRQTERHDALPVGCFTVDPMGLVTELNQAAARMLGIPRQDAPGRPLGSFFGSADAGLLGRALAGMQAGRVQPPLRLVLQADGDAPQPVLASIARDPAAGGCLVCLLPLG